MGEERSHVRLRNLAAEDGEAAVDLVLAKKREMEQYNASGCVRRLALDLIPSGGLDPSGVCPPVGAMWCCWLLSRRSDPLINQSNPRTPRGL